MIVIAAMLSSVLVASAAAVPSGARLEFFATGLDDEVMAIAYPPGDDRMFIAERAGLVKVIMPDGTVLPTPVLDIRAASFSINGIVFSPDFQSNGLFYVYAIQSGMTRILEYQMSSADPNVADVSTRRVVLERQRDSNFHAGGQMLFGPSDGYLYMSLGDGGEPPGDPWENGQDITTIDSTIIRIDPVTGDGAPGNPFIGQPGDDAIWIYGLRHPWRFSFDPVTDLMYIGDVGSGTYEEINIVAPTQGGDNFGWDVMEGTNCFEPPQGNEPPCGDPIYVLPTLQYSHAVGCSVIGGYVYHGTQIPSMQNQYFYSDYCEGWIKSFEYVDGQVTNEQDWTSLLGSVPLVTTWGQDNAGELSLAVNGTIYKIVPDGPPPEAGTIAGTVWADDNLDGLQTGESGVAGIPVELWVDANTDGTADIQLDAAVTDGAGNYQFAGLATTSTYIVRFDPPVGNAITLRDVGGDDTIDSDPDPTTGFTDPINLSANEVNDTIDAGVVPAPFGTISGRIWSDLDGDGLQGAGEPGFPGLFAWLYTDDDLNGTPDTKLASYAVDPDGGYSFDVDPAPTYFVRYGKQIFNNGELTLNLPNRTEWSPQDVGTDDTVDSDVNPAIGYAGPITVADGETNDTVDAGFVPLPATYAETVADDGATGHWRLGEATGTTAFDAVGTADAAYIGGPGLDSPPLIVDEDQAVLFDGVDDTVELVNSTAMNQGGPYAAKSVELWFNASNVTARQVLMEQGAITRGLNIYLDGGRLYAGMYNTDTFGGGTPWGPIFLDTPVSPNSTYHVAFVLDQPQDTLSLYVNGALADSAGGVGLLYNHSLSAIGAQRDWARFHTGATQGAINHFGGTIDEVAIYPTALDGFTVANHFTTGSEGAATNPTAQIIDPTGGTTVSGVTTIVVDATDDDPEGSLSVEVSTDAGSTWNPASWNPGSLRYEYSWDTTAGPNGPATLAARATDSDANTANALPVNVTVDNVAGTSPTVAIVGPVGGATVAGVVTVAVDAADDDPVGSLVVEVSTDAGSTWNPAAWNPGSLRYEYSWDTTAGPNGPVTLTARATDSDTNTTNAAPVAVTVDNPAGASYRDTVLAANPSIYWRVGESGGTTMLDEVGTNNQTYLGSPTLGAAALITDPDTAVDFDGVDDTVQLVNSVALNQGGPYAAKTIELWFNADDVTNRQVLLEQGSVSRGLNIYLDGGQLWAGIYNTDTFGGGTPWGPVFLSAPVATNTTYHVVVVFDAAGDSFSLYVNGALAATDSGVGLLYNHGRSAIGSEWDWARFHDGARFGNQYYYNGTLDEIAIYPTPLNPTTITNHYTTGTS